MKESDLWRPVKAWLLARGCTKVCPEVPLQNHAIDAVGVGEALVIGVELKLCLTWKAIRQGQRLDLCCDRAYIAIASKPRKLEEATQHGIGVIRIHKGRVEVLAEPNPKNPPIEYYRETVIRKVAHMSDRGVGGVPCLDGVGPAQDCKRRVEKYRALHPDARWVEIYEKVPNHYASAKSMSGALGPSMRRRELIKQLRKEGRFA